MSIRTLYILLIALILLGCSSREEFSPPDNPFDPGNPDYVGPEAEIISGPTEGEIVDSTSVTLVWQGNESATGYRYRFDGMDWSEWDETISQTFDYLDEGNHYFEIQARSINGDLQANSTGLGFGVDAVAGASVVIYPYLQNGSPGDTLIYAIMAEEVSDLFAVECQIGFNSDYLELIEVADGEILDEWGGEILSIQDATNSTVSTSLVAVEGSSISFTGTTSIITLYFRIKPLAASEAGIEAIEITDITYLNPILVDIVVNSSRIGVLNVD